MRARNVGGSGSVLFGVAQLLAVPGYYGLSQNVLSLGVGCTLVAFGAVLVFHRQTQSHRGR
ncbi:hypothetical protein [Haladaptatus sp. CMSO5]|uniref:hypothetical protein n=1 Tax=Haladaptatus sp. CMSO5 TaxID=3120514 RepID=UPI002FCE1766